MFTSRLKSGEKVYLHKWGDNDSKGVLTRIEIHLPSKNEVVVWSPQISGRIMNLNTETFYDLRMFAETSEYRFKVKFIEHDEAGGFATSRFKLMHDGEKILRRDAFRLNLEAMVVFSIILEDGHQSEKDEGKLVDLSVGGVKINTNREIEKGELLNISLQLDTEMVIAFGDVRYAGIAPPPQRRNQTKYAYEYGISFVMLTDSDQEKIIRYVYKKQREEIKNANARSSRL